MHNTTLTLLLAGSVLGLAASPSAAQQGTATVGDQPEFRFGGNTFNTMGLSGSQDLRGKPVLVEFWGTR